MSVQQFNKNKPFEVIYEDAEGNIVPEIPLSSEQKFAIIEVLLRVQERYDKQKKRLEQQPEGFPVDDVYICQVCKCGINPSNGWFSEYGNTCVLCLKDLKAGTIQLPVNARIAF